MSARRSLTRREFFKVCTLGAGSIVMGAALEGCERPESHAAYRMPAKQPTARPLTPTLARHTQDQPWMSASDALRSLIEGNGRFSRGESRRPRRDRQRRAETLAGQKPIAAILTCSDSRLPPEILFDQGIGDLFIVRTAGNLAGPVALGSLEYAVEHLAAPLVVVLGHQSCGAVSAAVQGGEAEGHIGHIVAALAPAVESARAGDGDLLAKAIDANILAGVEALNAAGPILAEFAEAGQIEIVGARYNLDTGSVEWLAGSQAMQSIFPPRLAAAETSAAGTPTTEPAPALTEGQILGVHVVRRGESLFAIGQAYGVQPAAIARQNGLANPNLIYSGQRLQIPNAPWRKPPPGKAAERQF